MVLILCMFLDLILGGFLGGLARAGLAVPSPGLAGAGLVEAGTGVAGANMGLGLAWE